MKNSIVSTVAVRVPVSFGPLDGPTAAVQNAPVSATNVPTGQRSAADEKLLADYRKGEFSPQGSQAISNELIGLLLAEQGGATFNVELLVEEPRHGKNQNGSPNRILSVKVKDCTEVTGSLSERTKQLLKLLTGKIINVKVSDAMVAKIEAFEFSIGKGNVFPVKVLVNTTQDGDKIGYFGAFA